MVEVNFTLSDDVARALGETPQSVGRRILENAAIENYRVGRLSQRQVGDMLGFDYWQTERFLTENHVELNYTAADLENDRLAMAKISEGQ